MECYNTYVVFQNRKEAGILLSQKLDIFHNDLAGALVLAIPRGGVVVGAQIADRLHLPLDIIVIKKLRAPGNSELAIGAVGPNGVQFIDWECALRSEVEQNYLDSELTRKRKEVEERVKKFSTGKWHARDYKKIILVDDGVATGATVLAALQYIGQKIKIILAVPVIAKDMYDTLESEVDKIVALDIPDRFNAVGEFYKEFPQVSDEEVVSILSNLSLL